MASSKASVKTKRTGMSRRMRAWMQARAGTKNQRRFTSCRMCEELAFCDSYTRVKARAILAGFVQRGEVLTYTTARGKAIYYLYNRTYHRPGNGKINKRIYKAIYVAAIFTVSDIVRLGAIKKPKWADRVVRQLLAAGYLEKVGRQTGAGGKGAANLWRVIDRDKFKTELMP